MMNFLQRIGSLMGLGKASALRTVAREWRKRPAHKANPRRLRPWLASSLGRIRDKNIRPRFPRWARAHVHGWMGHAHR